MDSRRIPIAIRLQLKGELERLTAMGVIAPVDEPTLWISQVVVVKKTSGALTVCVDSHELNRALQRKHYTLPISKMCYMSFKEQRFSRRQTSCLALRAVSGGRRPTQQRQAGYRTERGHNHGSPNRRRKGKPWTQLSYLQSLRCSRRQASANCAYLWA